MFAASLRNQLTQFAKQYALAKNFPFNTNVANQPMSAIIFDNIEHNFYAESWRTILANKENYLPRTQKAHSRFDELNSRAEMQSSNSSDALLMNIFCHPNMQHWQGVKQLLNLENDIHFQFGYQPGIALKNNRKDRTEIDLLIPSKHKKIFCESKLTEANFGFAPKEKLEDYECFEEVFNTKFLIQYKNQFTNYQLLRNILAAQQENASFYLFIDARRPDLAKSFMQTIRCIKNEELRNRCELFYWQEIALLVGRDLQNFLNEKYGI
jgi:hypothetical protein